MARTRIRVVEKYKPLKYKGNTENTSPKQPLRSERRRTTVASGVAIVSSMDEGALDGLNRSLDDMVELLEREIERLKASLEFYRLSDSPNREEQIRFHVRQIDQRQDALEDLRSMREN